MRPRDAAWRTGLAGAVGVAAGSVLRAWHTFRAARGMPRMSAAGPGATVPPLVTVVVPARNEEAVLGSCLGGLHAQTHARLRVVVVDDASTDGTGALARRHARDDPRITVATSTGPPAGWAGKPHAMHVGVRTAGHAHAGEWLLFLDADTEPAPDLVTRLLATAAELDADLISTPGGPPPDASWGWSLLMPPGTQLICENAAPDGRGRKAFAIGHCILVRRAAFDAVGGWAALASVGNEDVALATAVRDSGRRTRTVSSAGTLVTHGMDPFATAWTSFRKSFSVGTRGSVPLLAGAGVAHLAFGLTPALALVTGWRHRSPLLLGAAGVAWVAQAAGHARAARSMHAPVASGPAAPLAWAAVGVLFLDAAHRVRTGAMRWKERPLAVAGSATPVPRAAPQPIRLVSTADALGDRRVPVALVTGRTRAAPGWPPLVS